MNKIKQNKTIKGEEKHFIKCYDVLSWGRKYRCCGAVVMVVSFFFLFLLFFCLLLFVCLFVYLNSVSLTYDIDSHGRVTHSKLKKQLL